MNQLNVKCIKHQVYYGMSHISLYLFPSPLSPPLSISRFLSLALSLSRSLSFYFHSSSTSSSISPNKTLWSLCDSSFYFHKLNHLFKHIFRSLPPMYCFIFTTKKPYLNRLLNKIFRIRRKKT